MSEAVQVQTKWSELIEREKRVYIIEILDVEKSENGTIQYTKIRMTRRFYPIYPYGNYVETNWIIEWDGRDIIQVKTTCVYDSWGGTGANPIGEVTISITLWETPWFFSFDDLSDTIQEFGVKRTIKWILEDLKRLAEEALSVLEGEQ
jgi:hypothetical protein